MLHHGLVELRNLSYAQDSKRAADLADLLEIVPVYMAKWEDSFWDQIHGSVAEYQRRYPRRYTDLLSWLDNDPDPSFTRPHGPP
jgi:hypothetical protein